MLIIIFYSKFPIPYTYSYFSLIHSQIHQNTQYCFDMLRSISPMMLAISSSVMFLLACNTRAGDTMPVGSSHMLCVSLGEKNELLLEARFTVEGAMSAIAELSSSSPLTLCSKRENLFSAFAFCSCSIMYFSISFAWSDDSRFLTWESK